MRIGDIIRRKALDGAPIGPYMRIEALVGDRVYAQVPNLDEPNILIMKKNVHVCTSRCVLVSENILERLAKEEQISVSHPLTKMWFPMLHNPPEIIIFRTMIKDYRHCFAIDNVERFKSLGEHMIRIVVAEKVY